MRVLYYYMRAQLRRQFNSRDTLLAWQDERVQQHIEWVLTRSEFYREQFARLRPDQWKQAPLIDKSIMMDNFNTLNTAGISKEEAFAAALHAEETRDFVPTIGPVTVGLSSGTSGNRGLFLVSPGERCRWAGEVLARLLPTSILAPQRIAFFLRANSNLYTSVRSKRIAFHYFDLLDPVEQHIEHLNRVQPTILAGPPSMLRFLAEAQQRGSLHIAPLKVISFAEVLDPLDERAIAEGFQQKVHQVYQCTEGFLASTCEHGTLHLAEDIVAIQKDVIDADKRKFAPIITDFSRRTQPIIRYRLNDILTERAEPCLCGSVMLALESIEGRQDDVFYFPKHESTELIPVFPDYIRRAVISASDEISSYVVRQVAADQIEVGLTVTSHSPDQIQNAIRASVERLCNRVNCATPKLIFTEDDTRPGVRKVKRVERLFEPEPRGLPL